MITLGIESSCDETSAALVKDSLEVLSCEVSSSVHLHSRFGGIIPEIASRYHLEYIVEVAQSALKKANLKFKDIDLIAATCKPGLVGSLLVGLSFAKGLSFALNKPFIGVNHIEAHLFSPFLGKGFVFPFIGLVVSGGHTSLALVKDFDKIRVFGHTRDDAAGEAFDKVAKILDLGYPGGPIIDRLAATVNESPFRFNCARLEGSFDFSYSGIKTDVLYKVQKLNKIDKRTKARIAYSFQKAAIDIIVEKSIRACKKFRVNTLSAGGGVACNSYLRERLKAETQNENITFITAETKYCLDNAAMIAALGSRLYKKGKTSSYTLTASASS